MRHIALLLILFLAFAAVMPAQLYMRDPPVPHITRTFYFPCYSYWFAGSHPDPVGCASYATCGPPEMTGSYGFGVAWYEWWSCANGFVIATSYTGMVDGVYIQDDLGIYQSFLYDLGLEVNGFSEVHKFYPGGFQLITTFQGGEYQDCNGMSEYSGGYSYSC